MTKNRCETCQYADWLPVDRQQICTNCILGNPPKSRYLGDRITKEQALSVRNGHDDIECGDYFVIDGHKFTAIAKNYFSKDEFTPPVKHVVIIPDKK